MNDQTNARLKKGSLSPYEARVELATSALLAHSELQEDEARSMAERVLHAIDTVPEHIR